MLQRVHGAVVHQVARVGAAGAHVIGRHVAIHAADVQAGQQNIVVDGKAGDACYFLFHNHFLPKKRNVKSRKRRHYTASTTKLQGLHPGGQRAESVS